MMRRERAYEKYAWVILFGLSAFWVIRGLAAMLLGGAMFDIGLRGLTGKGWNQLLAQSPAIATFINGNQYEGGAFMIGFGLFGMVISSTGYRRGERAAWYTSWIMALVVFIVFPIALGANTPFAAVGPPPGQTVEGGPIAPIAAAYVLLILLTLAGLILPYRKFFPKTSH